jgi:hypothetical protein
MRNRVISTDAKISRTGTNKGKISGTRNSNGPRATMAGIMEMRRGSATNRDKVLETIMRGGNNSVHSKATGSNIARPTLTRITGRGTNVAATMVTAFLRIDSGGALGATTAFTFTACLIWKSVGARAFSTAAIG